MIPLNSCHSTVIYLLYIFLRDDGSPYSVRHLDPREVTWLLGVLGHMSDVRCRPTQPALALLIPNLWYIIVPPSIRRCPWQLWGPKKYISLGAFWTPDQTV
jgi:hypothetical protein